MTRVYLINLSFGLAGIERRFANLWHVLRRRGRVEPILAVPSTLADQLAAAQLLPDDPAALRIVPEPAALAWLGRRQLPEALHTPRSLVRSRASALGYRSVWREIRRDPDAVVHIGMPCSALTPPDVPIVYECVDATFRSFRSGHFRRASQRRALVHCQTDRIRTGLDQAYAGQATRWQTLTNPTYFAHYPDIRPDVRRDPTLVAFVGRLQAIKSPLLFVEAIARARQKGSDVRAIMLGEGPMQAAVEGLIGRHGLADRITVEFHLGAPALLSGAAVYASLQSNDNYGSQALLEAMGAGCAILASDMGETRRIVTDEVGVAVPLEIEAVADAIVAMVADPARTRARGAAGSRIARTTYSADTYAAFLESVYDQARLYHRAGAA